MTWLSREGARSFGAALVGLVLVPCAAGQAWQYPSLQPPFVSHRDVTALVSFSGQPYGTSGVVQWREGLGNGPHHLTFELGVAGGELGTKMLAGAAIAQRVVHQHEDLPVSMLLTAGAYTALFSGGNFLRIPIGFVLGSRVPLGAGSKFVTPYVHPRLSLEVCATTCSSFGHMLGTYVNLGTDVGADLELAKWFSLGAAFTFGEVSRLGARTTFGMAAVVHPAGFK